MKEKALKRYAHFISILLNIVCIVFGEGECLVEILTIYTKKE